MVKEVHRYEAFCEWQGTTRAGYEHYSRTHVAWAPPAPTRIAATADPAFLGDPRLLNAEQLLVIAAASCQLLSFLAVASRAGVDVLEYRDHAIAEMPQERAPIHVTSITLRPEIVVARATSVADIMCMVRQAHDECYIANSLKANVAVNAIVRIQPRQPTARPKGSLTTNANRIRVSNLSISDQKILWRNGPTSVSLLPECYDQRTQRRAIEHRWRSHEARWPGRSLEVPLRSPSPACAGNPAPIVDRNRFVGAIHAATRVTCQFTHSENPVPSGRVEVGAYTSALGIAARPYPGPSPNKWGSRLQGVFPDFADAGSTMSNTLSEVSSTVDFDFAMTIVTSIKHNRRVRSRRA